MANNVLGEPLQPCSMDPLTGWYRDGCCNTDASDHGRHVVCVRATPAFLAYSKGRGNDLSTPNPTYQFPGVQSGDQWCLCAARWLEALQKGVAPPVVLESTHESALELIPLEILQQYAIGAGQSD